MNESHINVPPVRTRFHVLNTKNWGSRMPNGTWNGVIGMLTKDEADVSTTSLIATSERMEVVDFLAPIYDVR
jgi:hypothetical protein